MISSTCVSTPPLVGIDYLKNFRPQQLQSPTPSSPQKVRVTGHKISYERRQGVRKWHKHGQSKRRNKAQQWRQPLLHKHRQHGGKLSHLCLRAADVAV